MLPRCRLDQAAPHARLLPADQAPVRHSCLAYCIHACAQSLSVEAPSTRAWQVLDVYEPRASPYSYALKRVLVAVQQDILLLHEFSIETLPACTWQSPQARPGRICEVSAWAPRQAACCQRGHLHEAAQSGAQAIHQMHYEHVPCWLELAWSAHDLTVQDTHFCMQYIGGSSSTVPRQCICMQILT